MRRAGGARKGERAGLKSRSNPSSPTFSQGKVQLPPPLRHNPECRQLREGSDSEAIALRENARSYNNALSFTSLAAHWDQTQVGTLGPPVFRVFGRLYHRLGALIPAVNQCPAFAQTWLINPAEATDTRLEPDGADSHMQRSTLTKLESGHRCPDGRPKYQVVSSLHPSAMPLRYPTLFAAEENSSHLNTPLCGFHQAGPPIARNREQIDNGVQLREVLPVSVWMTNEEDKDRDDEDEDREEGDEEDGDGERQRSSKGVEVASLAFTILCALLAKGNEYFSIPHCTHGPFLESVIYGYTPSRDRSTLHIRLHQENLHLTTTQGINGLAPNPIGRCTGAAKACNRPDLIARVFEAKSGNKRHAGCFGDECKMNGFCFFAVLRVVFS
ncbi:BQ5605_C005g03577 [Microbotryum silenes-dioicae]|uniref:BQ5605_C005g03577 protein n=1 Tax=Microbotryum silenes-dioicae TaxID=796604 RepID=A0A2X0PDD0_9BASI|nr:BQ5605_C005g03577 [Microbotryum silenes-dioicae]